MKHQIIVTDINLWDFDGRVADYLKKGWKVVHLAVSTDSTLHDVTEPLVGGIYNNTFIAIMESPR